MRSSLLLALLGAVAMALPAVAQGPEPKPFEDCLLKHLPGTESDLAAKYIAQACARKFNPWSSSTKKPTPQASDRKDEWWLDSSPVTDPKLLKELEQED